MGDEDDALRTTKELGLRLRSLRKRARLTPSELALDVLDRFLHRK